MITKTCYLLCFAKPIGDLAKPSGWARHYLGSSTDLDAELARFRRNGGHAKIMQELHRQGIDFELVRTWPGGRETERWLKDKHGPVRLCPRCGPPPRDAYWNGDGTMIGGYSVVAGVLNQRFTPQPPVSRSRVYHWYIRGTKNHAGQPPPQPVEERPDAPRTQARHVFDTEHWVVWFAAGIPGPHNKGWRVWVDTGTPAAVGGR